MSANSKTSELIQFTLFVAIIILLSVTPLGYISLGVINATTIQIPVILGSLIFGWKKGAFLGLTFGITSLLKNTFQPGITSFVFSPFVPVFGEESGSVLSLIVCLVPRILIGVVPYFVCKLIENTKMRKTAVFALSGFLGSLTNTILVMSGIYIFFGRSYSAAKDMAYENLIKTVMATITGIGVTEAVVSAVITASVGIPVIKYLSSRKSRS